ncbi:unnamed protein product [Effrenium voratum]|nr:unnamed protein product [Effrenium voratum]|mmetsp:Transcript_79007/g.189746  ORF Transcript_79007/g.189746 Transcript_79007/m.189746 type:complete len:189 (-) Transcript_79007:54-620(-)
MLQLCLVLLFLGADAIHEERPSELLRKAWPPQPGVKARSGASFTVSHGGHVESLGQNLKDDRRDVPAAGPAGPRGEPGGEGPAGDEGDKGPNGAQGDKGEQGEVGDPGETGGEPEQPKVPAGAAKASMLGVAFVLHLAVLGAVYASISGKVNAGPKAGGVSEAAEGEYNEGEEYGEEAMPEEEEQPAS